MTAEQAVTLNEKEVRGLARLLVNYSSLRQAWREKSEQKRDVSAECDYPENPTAWDYKRLYDREPIAHRIVDLYPDECWKKAPTVYEKGTESDDRTAFEEAWDNLGRTLRGEQSWHAQEEGSLVWNYLHQLDEQSGIGHYGILLLGLDDIPALGTDPAQVTAGAAMSMADPVSLDRKHKLIFIKVLPESACPVTQWDADPASPRYGKPVRYSVTVNDPIEGQQSGSGLVAGQMSVHWTRVIHVADSPTRNEAIGVPRMKAPMNRIKDLEKEYGAIGEAVWLTAFPTTWFPTHPQLGVDVEVNHAALKDMMENIRQGLQRHGALEGLDAKTLPPNTLDPTPYLNAAIEAICIVMGCPVRVFKGSERGELASSQDDDSWTGRVDHRRQTHCTPNIIVRFVDRLILYGILPEPSEGYIVSWPDLKTRSDGEKASVGLQRMQSLASFVQVQAAQYLTPHDFFVSCWGCTDEEAEALVEAAQEEMKRQQEEQLRAMQQAAPEDPFADEPGLGFGGTDADADPFGIEGQPSVGGVGEEASPVPGMEGVQ